MSATTYSNQPAFPLSEETTDRVKQGIEIFIGLTKREYFAAMAMQALISSNPNDSRSYYAQEAIIMADALIIELNKQP